MDTGARDPAQTLAKWLEDVLHEDAIELRLQTGFFSLDGMGLLAPFLKRSAEHDQPLKLLIGSNNGCTLGKDILGLIELSGIPRANALVGIVGFGTGYFHPKTYHVRRNDGSEAAYVGSANLSPSGLALHIEAGIALDTREGDSAQKLLDIAVAVDAWFHERRRGLTIIESRETVENLLGAGVLATTPSPHIPIDADEGEDGTRGALPRLNPIFSLARVKLQVAAQSGALADAGAEAEDTSDLPEEALQEDSNDIVVEHAPPASAQDGNSHAFLMTLQRTDVGVGQTTKGTSRRSPEIFIPLAARNADPAFWGWPHDFVADPSKLGKMDRTGVKMRLGTTIFDVNMMTWPDKHDFRLRSEQLRSAGNIGDILYLERSDGKSGFTYYVEVVPPGVRYAQYLALCVNSVKNSKRRWGYI